MHKAKMYLLHPIKTLLKLQIHLKIMIRTNNLKSLITKIRSNIPKTHRAKIWR